MNASKSAGHFAAAGGMNDMNRLPEIELLDQLREIVRVAYAKDIPYIYILDQYKP